MSEGVIAPRWVRAAAKWVLPTVAEKAIAQLQAELGTSRLAASVLAHRGYTDLASAQQFLSPTLLHDPFELRDMDRAIARIQTAIRNRESILI
jgi:single-stranded-DNA-specific exonuclease